MTSKDQHTGKKSSSKSINIIMKFEDLYNKIYISEQDEKDQSNEVPMPEDFDDVTPLPATDSAPAAALEDEGTVQEEPIPSSTGNTLQGYIMELEKFANKLQSLDGDSLQTLVSRLDRIGTPFDGISARTKPEILKAVESLKSIAIELTSFLINAAKK